MAEPEGRVACAGNPFDRSPSAKDPLIIVSVVSTDRRL